MGYVSINSLSVGDLVEYAARVQPSLVAEVNPDSVTLQNGVVLESGTYVNYLGSGKMIVFFTNQKSGVTHATIDGKPLCGIRHGRNSVSSRVCTCEACNKIISS